MIRTFSPNLFWHKGPHQHWVAKVYQPSGLVSSATLSREIEIFLGEAKDVTTFRKRLLPTTHLMGLAGLRSHLRWYKDHINDSMEHPRNGWMPPLQ